MNSNSQNPLVSVLVSTYNAERFLPACLENLERQTIADRLEIIVIDSGSQQNERAIVEQFQKRYGNIVYLRTERETLYAAWNCGIELARGKYVTNANSDDSHRPHALEKLSAALEAFPEADLAYGDYFTTTVPNDTFDNPRVLRRIVHPPYHPATLMFYCVTGCHPMWRRTVFDKIGLFDPTFTAPGDYEFVLRFCQAGLRAVKVPEILSLFYQNPDGLSFRPDSKADEEFKRIRAAYRAGMPIQRLYKLDEADPSSLASGWVALGNYALRHEIPWFDNACQDLPYAIHCYTSALRHDPQNIAALHNLIVAKILRGEADGCEWTQLPAECAKQLKRNIARGQLELMEVNVRPAVEPLDFPTASSRAGSGLREIVSSTASQLECDGPKMPVRLVAPFFDDTDDAVAARRFILSLSDKINLGALDQTDPFSYSQSCASSLPPAEDHCLRGGLKRYPLMRGGIAISQAPAPKFTRVPDAIYSIGRTSFNGNRLPLSWVRLCNLMDEIWVPTEGELEKFARSGVERNKLVVIPSAEHPGDRALRRLEEIQRMLTIPARTSVTMRESSAEIEPSVLTEPIHVSWEGSFLDLGSLSHVNREITRCLVTERGIHLSCVGKNALSAELANMPILRTTASRLISQPPRRTEVTVRHAWPPRWDPPESGAWVIIQPWEYGALPQEWTRQLARVDEVWAPSEYVRRVYVDSGVPPNKVKVVPNGIDPQQFHPAVPPLPLATNKSFKFLFVGGTIPRKGADLLLAAYLEAFTAADEVCLVIKDFGGKDIYAGQTFQSEIKAAQANPDAPEILYLERDLSPDELAGLYTTCDCLVHPYRGEGFALPVLEAMACGLPVVVTAGGATDDFATDEFAFRIPALRQPIAGPISGMPLVRPGWWLQPDRDALIQQMRWVVAHREDAREKGRRASEYVRREWNWERAGQIAVSRIKNLLARKRTEQTDLEARRARQSAPINPPAVAHIGELHPAGEHLRADNFVSAWTVTADALRVRPFHPEAWLLLAEVAQGAGDFARARQCAERVRQLAPKWKPAKKFLETLPRKAGPSSERLSGVQEVPIRSPDSPTLSVCLITKNEERFLGRCLESVRTLADQIVIMDTGSTDKTVAIAQTAGAEVYFCEWQDDFSAARNAALEHVTGDWVLILDADEELKAETLEVLKKDIRVTNVMAYRLRILDKGREDEGHHYVPRLFRNAPGLFFVGRIHEQIFSSVEVRRRDWGLENELSAATIIHYGYDPQVQRERGKVARNLSLLERAIEEMPNEPHLLMNYGLELIRFGQVEEGLEQYWEAVHVMAGLPTDQIIPELRETLLTQLATQLLAARDFAGVVKLLELPLAKSSGPTASMHFLLGLALLESKRFAEAAIHFRHCIARRDRPVLSPIHKDIRKGAPRHCLALCLKTLQQAAVATKIFREALEEEPGSRPLRHDFARFLADQQQPVEALQLLFQLVNEKPDDLNAWWLGGQIALSRPDFLECARDWTAEAMKQFSANPQIVAQRAQALLFSGKADEALPLWRQLQASAAPKQHAALVLCELLAGTEPVVAPNAEAAVSQEFLTWYRRLLAFGAGALVEAVNARMETLQRVLPSASRVLQQAVQEAGEERLKAEC